MLVRQHRQHLTPRSRHRKPDRWPPRQCADVRLGRHHQESDSRTDLWRSAMLAARACSLATSACRMDNLTNPMNYPAEGESSPDVPMLHKPAHARIDTWITLAHRLSLTHLSTRITVLSFTSLSCHRTTITTSQAFVVICPSPESRMPKTPSGRGTTRCFFTPGMRSPSTPPPAPQWVAGGARGWGSPP